MYFTLVALPCLYVHVQVIDSSTTEQITCD